jgi:hypothetical protein
LQYCRTLFLCPKTKGVIPTERNQEIKADGGKLRLELIPTSTITSLGRVLTYGAQKYSANSWRQVERERYVGAILRHLVAYIDDPNGVDEESGLRHIEHVLCNAAFLNEMADVNARVR